MPIESEKSVSAATEKKNQKKKQEPRDFKKMIDESRASYQQLREDDAFKRVKDPKNSSLTAFEMEDSNFPSFSGELAPSL